MSQQAISVVGRSIRRATTTSTRSYKPSTGSFTTPSPVPQALSSLVPHSAIFRTTDQSQLSQPSSRSIHGRASFSTIADPIQLRSQNPHRFAGAQGLGLWLVAGAAPVCLFSTLSYSAAKEKGAVDLLGEVVLYQYEACPFCNKVKGRFILPMQYCQELLQMMSVELGALSA